MHPRRMKKAKRKPLWLKRRIPAGPSYQKVRDFIGQNRLHTVCQEAQCPNLWECFSKKTATFLILGNRCTRNCRFCAIDHDPTDPPDPREPERVSQAVEKMGLRYVVVTSVTRDDLSDGGAGVFAETIRAIRKRVENIRIEVLIPDFQGNVGALETVLSAEPDVLNHNIETVERLYPIVRPEAVYPRSLSLLYRCSVMRPTLPLKSGLMLGLGERREEIVQAMKDSFEHGCRMLTLGQYLQPTQTHLPVTRFLPPSEFEELRSVALQIGFDQVASGPFVRSSYNAKSLFGSLRHQSEGAAHEEIYDSVFNR